MNLKAGLLPMVAAWLVLSLGAAEATTQTRGSSFSYDSSTGLLLKEVIEPGDSDLCLVTEYQYDAYGNKTSVTKRNCNGSTNESVAPKSAAVFQPRVRKENFDAGSVVIGGMTYAWSAGLFPTTSTNALEQSERKKLDPRFGAVVELVGPNGLTTTWEYDGFGRKSKESRSDGTYTTWTYQLCASLSPAACPTHGTTVVTVSTFAPGAVQAGPTVKRYADTLGREIRIETQGFDGSAVYKDARYDNRGRLTQTSHPYYPGQTPAWTTFSYDDLNRVTTETAPTTSSGTRTTTIAYAGLVVTTTLSNAGSGTGLPDGVTQTKTVTRNSQKQITEVRDAQSNVLTYAYDPFGNLIQTNAGGVITTLGYDLRGRKKSLNDSDMGNWTYAYNALGELTSQTDAKKQTTTMAYDKLGRMTNRAEPALLSNWYYDAYKGGMVCTNGIGKLCEAETDNGYRRKIAYDDIGRPTAVTTTIDSTYTVSTSYVASGAHTGRVDTITYPTGFAVKHEYTSLGFLIRLKNNADQSLFWQANTVDAQGRVLNELLGNNLTTTRAYDAIDQLTLVTSADTGNTVHAMTFDYDPTGNLTRRGDTVNAVAEMFTYDTLNRLKQASGPGLATRSFDYNAIGNMTLKSDVGTYTYPVIGEVRPHAVASVKGPRAATYGYDANGNLETVRYANGNRRTLTYASFNLPNTVTGVQGGQTFGYTYTYNSEHERVRLVTDRTDGAYTRIYLGIYEKEIKPGNITEHRHFVGNVGVYITKSTYRQGDGPQMRYFHKDHLGSIDVITNPNGAVIERLAYESFGKRRFPNGTADPTDALDGVTTDRGYTGHEHLDELDLIHMNGRIYDPNLARFVTADPFIDSKADLQSYNRYSYVNNNPLAFTDPNGLFKLRKLFRSKIFVMAIAIAATVATSGAMSEYFIGQAGAVASGTGFGSTAFATFSAAEGAIGGSLTVLGGAVTGAVAGAAGGFAGGFAASEGDLKVAFEAAGAGAIGGGIFGGIDAFYGGPASYPFSRVVVQGVGGGISSELSGGSFRDGFTSSFGTSLLTFGDLKMREYIKRFARNDPRSDGTGLGICFRGDCDKVAGGWYDPGAPDRPSDLGGFQGKHEYMFFGKTLSTSTLAGRLGATMMEAFAGPHDTANSAWWYDKPLGRIRAGIAGAERLFGELAINYSTSLVFAMPFAAAAMVPEASYGAVFYLQKFR